MIATTDAKKRKQAMGKKRKWKAKLATPHFVQVLDDTVVDHYATQVRIQIARGHWDAAHAVVNAAQREVDRVQKRKPLDVPIHEAIDVRTGNTLEQVGIYVLRDLENVSRDFLLSLDNMGEGTITKIVNALRNAVLLETGK